MNVDVLSALVRALSFIAQLQAAGVAIFIAVFGRHLSAASREVRRIGFYSAVAGIVLVFVHYGLEAARMAGALSGVFDLSLQQLVLETPLSTAWILRSAGLALIVGSIRSDGVRAAGVCVLGAILTLAAFLLVGHTATDPARISLAVLLIVHLVVVAFWFGALLPLHAISDKESELQAARVVDDFSRIAIWLVPVILLAGVLMTVLLVDRWTVFAESYGLLLLAKVAAFAALMGLAAMNKWRYGPALATTRAAAVGFQRAVMFEYALICAVLIATAIMTTFFSPEH